jgi:hypothetical protein
MTPPIVKTIKTRAERPSGRARARSQPEKKPSRHMSSRGYLDVIEGGAKIAAAILTASVLRGPHNRWDATPLPSHQGVLRQSLVQQRPALPAIGSRRWNPRTWVRLRSS